MPLLRSILLAFPQDEILALRLRGVAESPGIADRIIVRTAVSADELRDIYRNALVFVLPSYEEGFGFVLVEAMSCGCPVIRTRTAGPETIVEHGRTGMLTPVDDSQVLSAAMKWMMDSPLERQNIGNAGRMAAVERFSHAAAASIVLEVYHQLL